MKTSNFSHVCDAINIIVRHLFSLPISLVHYSIMSTLEFASISSIYAHNRNITEALPGKKDKTEKKKRPNKHKSWNSDLSVGSFTITQRIIKLIDSGTWNPEACIRGTGVLHGEAFFSH